MVEFRILGSLEVVDDGREIPLGGTRQRAVLAILALHRGNVVSVDRLVDELWGERTPDTAVKTLQVYVSRLRKALGGTALITQSGGYLLDLDPGQLDSHRFETLAGEGRKLLARGDAGAAAEQLRRALDLWRGPPLADFSYDSFAQGEIARLEELRLVVLEDRIDADLALGRHAELVPELESLARAHGRRERLRGQLMLALYRSGRQSDALESYRDARRTFVDELGLEPGRELQGLERAILTQDPALDPPPRTRSAETGPRRGRRGGAILALGGGLLLAALVAIVAAGGEHDPASQRVAANSLAVIDPSSNETVATIPTGIRPADVAEGAGYIWVANRADNTLTQVDAETKRVVSTTSPGMSVGGLAADARGVWIADGRRARLIRLDPGFRPAPVADSIRLAPAPDAFGPSGANSVALGHGSVWAGRDYGTIARVDAESHERARPISVGNSPIAVATGAGSVWVADDQDNTVIRIDPQSANAVTATTPVGQGPTAVAVGAGAVWVASAQDDTVARLDPGTAAVTATIRVGRRPTGVAVGAGAVWVANSLSGTVSRIDPETNRVEATLELAEAPQGITVARGLVWVSVQQRVAPPPSSRAASGGVVRLTVPDDPAGDPALESEFQHEYARCALLYNYPDRPFPEGARLRPELAAGPPSISPDGRTYEFRVRPGFRFSPPSNEPVTARALEHTIERALNPKMGSYAAALMRDVTAVRARGDRLLIRLKAPAPDLPARLAAPYFCALPANTPIDPDGVDAVPTAGPYYVAAHVPGRSLVLRRNPGYHGPRPRRLAEIRYSIGVSATRGVAAVEAGRADYVEPGPQEFASVPDAGERRLLARYGPRSEAARAGRQQLFIQPTPTVYYFMFNTRRGPFTDLRLRRAVNYALDRRALAAHTGIGEGGRPSDQHIPPGMPGFEDAAIYPLGGPDLATARRLAGHARRRAVLYTCNYPACTRHAQILRANLQAIGIELEVRQFNLGEMFDRINNARGHFDLAYYNWFVDVVDPFNYINIVFGADTSSRHYFRNAEAERRMNAAARLSGDARLKAYAEVDAYLARRAIPAAPFASGTTSYFLSARIGCHVLHPIYGLDLAALCLRKEAEDD